jgi:hypothetical protein
MAKGIIPAENILPPITSEIAEGGEPCNGYLILQDGVAKKG